MTKALMKNNNRSSTDLVILRSDMCSDEDGGEVHELGDIRIIF